MLIATRSLQTPEIRTSRIWTVCPRRWPRAVQTTSAVCRLHQTHSATGDPAGPLQGKGIILPLGAKRWAECAVRRDVIGPSDPRIPLLHGVPLVLGMMITDRYDHAAALYPNAKPRSSQPFWRTLPDSYRSVDNGDVAEASGVDSYEGPLVGEQLADIVIQSIGMNVIGVLHRAERCLPRMCGRRSCLLYTSDAA